MKPITDNELIAEFMGGVFEEMVIMTYGGKRDGKWIFPDRRWCYNDQLQYDTSWDRLMPVVEKIAQIKGSHFIYDHTVLEIFMYGKRIVRIGDATMIGNYYNGVVEFIKWYNTHKNENI